MMILIKRPLFLSFTLILLVGTAALAADINPPSIHSDRGAWPICRQWTQAEIQHFADWIEHIYIVKNKGTYTQQTARIERVLTDPEMNLLLDPEFAGEGCNEQLDAETMRALHYVLDCAKLTVTLSSYYAYRRGLPWTISYVRACDGGDVRRADYTTPGSVVSTLDYASPGQFFRDAVTGTCTGNFRVEPNRKNSELSDTVPVAIHPEYLIPGCLFYLDGHVLVLAHVTPHGEVKFLDSTVAPSRDIYAYNAFNVVSGIAGKKTEAQERAYDGCFRGFRVYRWPVAEVDESGRVMRIRRRTDEEMKDFGVSTEQYDKIEELTETGKIREGGVSLDSFQQFVRFRLRTAKQIHLYDEIKAFAAEMAAMLQARDQKVQEAWREVNENGPIQFPADSISQNVFTVGGRWGQYASAMADVMLRGRYFEFMDHLNYAIAWFDVLPGEVDLGGFNKHAIWTHADMAAVVVHTKNQLFKDAVFSYTDSNGNSVPLTLLDMEARLYDMSFDPNHPPELRWGEPLDTLDVASLPGKDTPLPGGKSVPMLEAYNLEAYYRALSYWEPEPSALRGMTTTGFPVRDKFDASLTQKWIDGSSPPLVPHNGKAAWVAQQK